MRRRVGTEVRRLGSGVEALPSERVAVAEEEEDGGKKREEREAGALAGRVIMGAQERVPACRADKSEKVTIFLAEPSGFPSAHNLIRRVYEPPRPSRLGIRLRRRHSLGGGGHFWGRGGRGEGWGASISS